MTLHVAEVEAVVPVELLNEREFSTSFFRNTYGIPRSKLLISNNRGGVVCRKTLFAWDSQLQSHPKMADYRRDPHTKESLWEPGKPWNLHQAWCLQKLADFMQTPSIPRFSESRRGRRRSGEAKSDAEPYLLRCPTYAELFHYLWYQQETYTHKQFFQEYFKWPTTSN